MRTLVACLLSLSAAGAALAAPPTDEEIDAVARQLRCVVCQNLSVADSPSEMARQMREVVRERLAGGETPEAIKAYFVSRYGEWVLLSPPTRGFALLAWVLPFIGLGGGLAGALILLIRWTARGRVEGAEAGGEIDEADLAAVREALREEAR